MSVGAAADPDQLEELVFRWRQERFQELGFDPGQAQQLAMSSADWHRAAKLLDDDCGHELAFRILT